MKVKWNCLTGMIINTRKHLPETALQTLSVLFENYMHALSLNS